MALKQFRKRNVPLLWFIKKQKVFTDGAQYLLSRFYLIQALFLAISSASSMSDLWAGPESGNVPHRGLGQMSPLSLSTS